MLCLGDCGVGAATAVKVHIEVQTDAGVVNISVHHLTGGGVQKIIAFSPIEAAFQIQGGEIAGAL